ncbi:MAG: MATE family efflux transporter [Syntrophomonadaceae bacterium]|nr:MATE family efflux transporter [Syntrophomonadaceae bacterium]
MNRSQEMSNKGIPSLLWSFSLPAIVGMIVNSLYNVIDRIFVGQGIGPDAIAATTVAFPIMIILFAVSILIGVGATALISIRLGEQKMEEAEKIAGNATMLLIILPAIFATIFFLNAETILIFFGASDTVLPLANDFVHIIMLGSVFASISMGMTNFIRAEGNPKMAMYTQLIGAFFNVLFNYIFIFIFHWGIKGSALATITAQFISAMWVISYFVTNKSLVKIRFKNFKLELPIVLSIMAIGFAPFALQVANSVQQLILNRTLMYYGGDMALAAIGIIFSIGTLLIMPILGVSQGAQPIIGFNYGARLYGRVKETLKTAVLWGMCISTAGFLIIILFPTQLVGMFTQNQPELVAMTADAMTVFFSFIFIAGFQIIGSNYFQAVGKPVHAAILSLSRQVLIFIPLLLILPNIWGIDGVWRTAPIADILSVLLNGAFVFFEMRKLDKKAQENKNPNESTGGIEAEPVTDIS